MNPLCSNLYDKVKDRRYGLLFLMAWLAAGGLYVVGSLVMPFLEQMNWPVALSGIAVVGAAMLWRIWRSGGQSRERIKYPPLSCDEMRKARSKLVRQR